MKSKVPFAYYLLLITSVLFSFLVGFIVNNYIRTGFANFPILHEAHQMLQNNAFYDLPEGPALEYGMIRGMLDSYGDPYTRFVEPVQHELEDDQLSGVYGGIGVRMGTDPEGNVVLFPFPDGPAADAGILDGDILAMVEDLVVNTTTATDEIVAALRGPEGSRVSISIRRPATAEILEFRIKRQNIPLPSVTWHPDVAHPQIGIIQINLITATTTDELGKAIEDLLERGATDLLIDLRGNRGGLVDTGVDIASVFVDDGVLLEQTYRDQPTTEYTVRSGDKYLDIPLAVLIDQNTASSAEIIAGILQARDRAVLIGSNSFGKNTIQYVFTLSDESSIHVTSSQWSVPGLGYDIGEAGLVPDIRIEDGASETEIANIAYEYFVSE